MYRSTATDGAGTGGMMMEEDAGGALGKHMPSLRCLIAMDLP